MGKIGHADATGLDQSRYQSNSSHEIDDTADLHIVRGHSLVVALSNAPSAWLHEADVKCTGANDDLVIVQALSDAGYSGVLVSPGRCYPSGTITLGGTSDYRQSLTFAPGAFITPTADADLFIVGSSSILEGGTVYTGGISYTKAQVTLSGTSSRVSHMRLENAEGATATAYSIKAVGTNVTYNNVDDIKIGGGLYGIYMKPAVLASDIFLNRFTRIRMIHILHPLHEDNTALANLINNYYDYSYQAFGDANDIDIMQIEGNYNNIRGCSFDFVGASAGSLTTKSSKNIITWGGATDMHALCPDLGSNNIWIDGVGGLVYSRLNRPIQHLANGTHTLTEGGHSGKTLTNLGTTATVLINLPQNPTAGTEFEIHVKAAYAFRLNPGAAGAIYINGAKQTDNKYISCSTIGASGKVTADGSGDWDSVVTGTWTVEA